MIKCAVIGATGYAGAELARLLLGHPSVGELVLSSASAGGEAMSSIYPNLLGASNGVLVDKDEAIKRADVVFAALPAGHAEDIAAACAAKGALFIDMSADFRFGADEATYAKWYGKSFARPELHAGSVYGLPELNRAKIAALGPASGGTVEAGGAKVIGNPGCYPTASTLGPIPRPPPRPRRARGHHHRREVRRYRSRQRAHQDHALFGGRRYHHALQDRRAPARAGDRRRPRGDGRLSGRLAVHASPGSDGEGHRRDDLLPFGEIDERDGLA